MRLHPLCLCLLGIAAVGDRHHALSEIDESKASISTWIFTITRNTVIDYFRRNKIMDEPDENIAAEGEVDDNLLTQETLSELAGALTRLPDELQDAVWTRFYNEPRP